MTTTTITQAPSTLGFGDIAITSSGMLYGSYGTPSTGPTSYGLFSVNLAAPSNSYTSYTETARYQIALDPTQQFLYAEKDNSDGASGGGSWGTLSLSNGAYTSLGFNTYGFGDIADQTLITPEPTTLVMLGLAGLMGVAQSKLRKRRKALAA